MASCVCVLSAVNSPLLVLSSTPPNSDSALSDHYSLHTSLDVIEERSAGGNNATAVTAKKTHEQTRDLYLGSLFATEKKKVFGYVTNTRIKFVIIVDSSNTSLRDNEIRQMFRRLHSAYTQLMSNPFYVPGEKIKSKKFEAVVKGLLREEK